MERTIIIATTNQNKVKEIAQIKDIVGLKDWGILPITAIEPNFDVEETGETLEENTLLKLLAASELTDMPVIAEDSGLFVDALNGMPGIYSARYSAMFGDPVMSNNELLLRRLKGKDRSAKFMCCAGLRVDGRTTQLFSGELAGEILETPRGDGGFAYDPLFLPTHYNQTLGELPEKSKNSISHRFMAFARLFKALTII